MANKTRKFSKVRIKSPFQKLPIGIGGKKLPILMDRHFLNNISNYCTEHKLKAIHCEVVKEHIQLEFKNTFDATKFALGYAEIYGKTEPEIF